MWESSMVYGSSDDLPEEHAAVVDALRTNIDRETSDGVLEQAIVAILQQDPNNIKTTALLKEMTKILVLGREPRGITTREAEQQLQSHLRAGRWKAGLATSQLPAFFRYLTVIAQARSLPSSYPIVLYGLQILNSVTPAMQSSVISYAATLCATTTFAVPTLMEGWFHEPLLTSHVFQVLKETLAKAPKQRDLILAACASTYVTQAERVHTFLLTWLDAEQGDYGLLTYTSDLFQLLLSDLKPAITPDEAQRVSSTLIVVLQYLPYTWMRLIDNTTLLQKLFHRVTRILVALKLAWPEPFDIAINEHASRQLSITADPHTTLRDTTSEPRNLLSASHRAIPIPSKDDRPRSRSMLSSGSTPRSDQALPSPPLRPRQRSNSFDVGTPDANAPTPPSTAKDETIDPAKVLVAPCWRLTCMLYLLFPRASLALLRDLGAEREPHRQALVPLLRRLKLNPLLALPKPEASAWLAGKSPAELVEESRMLSEDDVLQASTSPSHTTNEAVASHLQQAQLWSLVQDLRRQVYQLALELEAKKPDSNLDQDPGLMISEDRWNEFRQATEAKMAVMKNRIQELQDSNEKLSQAVAMHRHRAASTTSTPAQPELDQLREDNAALKVTIKELSKAKTKASSATLGTEQLDNAFQRLNNLKTGSNLSEAQLGRLHMLEREVYGLTDDLKASQAKVRSLQAGRKHDPDVKEQLAQKDATLAKLQAELSAIDSAGQSQREALLQRCQTLENINARLERNLIQLHLDQELEQPITSSPT